ncbi:HIT domain-containing protein [Candidatus Woesearchaeota archaeon]|nr:HIT domain-containing protein [Candidatus Woesearchaeota archaeon]
MVTEEELKNMSPEQIAELQKQNCIFCHIVSGRVSSKKIYEDDKAIAVLDINPANPGHILLMPKEHHMIMPQMPDDLINHIGMLAKQLSHAALKALKVEGTDIFVANGAIAGQKSPHFMVHIIPRKENDGLRLILPENQIDTSQLRQLAAILKQKLRSADRESSFISRELTKSSASCQYCSEIKSAENIVFSDDEVCAFLSPAPASAGHVIVSPLEHTPIIENVPDFVVGRMFQIANRVSVAAFEAFGAQGTNLLITNGVPAGQKVPHVGLHVLPRKQGDNLDLSWTPRQLNEEEMSTIELQLKEQTRNTGFFEKKKPAPIELDLGNEEPEIDDSDIAPGRQETNYMLRHIRRIP